jgi:glycine cleavage system aminomethyltransferase T
MRKRLQIYVLRARVRLEDISDRVALLGLAGPQSVSRFRTEFGVAPVAPFDVVRIEDFTAMALPGQRIELAVSRASATSIWDRLVAAGCTPAGQARVGRPGHFFRRSDGPSSHQRPVHSANAQPRADRR